jgi:hypothetical protein
MAIQDEMYKAIEKEIDQTVESGTEKVSVNFEKAKEVAKMLTDLSTSVGDADALTNQYIANKQTDILKMKIKSK